MNKDSFEIPDQFTENAFNSFNNASKLAEDLSAKYVGTEHLLLGMLPARGFGRRQAAGRSRRNL